MAAASIAARGIPIEALVKRQTNRRVDARFESTRRGLGVQTIDLDEAPRKVPRALRAGRVIGMVADQDAGEGGVSVPFFGRPASAHRGPALFALRLGTPVFASAMHRLPGPGLAYEGTMERVPVERTGDLEADVRRLTAELAARLEAAVRKAPEQYFWFHRRWKSSPLKEHASGVTSTSSL
jgi:KDO2-lipid IV(A) lauroyltransferase